MTSIRIERINGKIVRVEASGHAGYAAEGEDIVCAAVSTLVQTALLGLLQVAALPAEYVRREAEGFMEIRLPELDERDRNNADMILETMLSGIADLYESYSDYIELEVQNKCL